MSDNGRSSAVLEQEAPEAEVRQQPQQVGGSTTSVAIRHVTTVHNHFYTVGQPQPASKPIPQPNQARGVVVSQRMHRGAIAAAAVAIAAAGILIGVLASRLLYPQQTEFVPVPMGVSERQAQDMLWRHAFTEAAVQTARALREAPGSPDALRASNSLELALTRQDANPWEAILSAAHAAKSAEAAQVIAANRP